MGAFISATIEQSSSAWGPGVRSAPRTCFWVW